MKQNVLIPVSIVLAGLVVAGAVFLVKRPAQVSPGDTGDVRAADATDYVLGNPAAPIKIIEYSDLECPYCKEFHKTMHALIDEYGSSGKVAWVYRHFPLTNIHPKAAKEAEAAECAGKLGGNTAFWKYIDRVYEVTPSSNGLDLAELPNIAEDVGLNRGDF